MDYKGALTGVVPQKKLGCEFKGYLECTVPNCTDHKKICTKCGVETFCVKVFKRHHSREKTQAHYINDYVCLSCRSMPIPNIEVNDGSLLHNIRCFNSGKCVCNEYYCLVDGCKNYRIHSSVRFGNNLDRSEGECVEHRLFCDECQEETFWIVSTEVSEDGYFTVTRCGPCCGYGLIH